MTDEQNTENSLKIILLGESGVGKTNLINVFMGKEFEQNSFTSLSSSYIDGVFSFKGKDFPYVIWDTAGQERFRTIAKSYYKGAHGIVLIYDVTNRKTYDNIRKWLNQIKDEASNKISIILVANKIDSEDRQVSVEEGETLAKASNLPIFEASAKDSINVEESFKFLIEQINENIGDFTPTQTSTQLNSKNKSQKKGCC